MKRWMDPLAIAGIVVGAPAMPEWVIATSALVLVGLSGWIFWTDRKGSDL